MKDWTLERLILSQFPARTPTVNSRQRSELGMVDAEMEHLQLFRCRNLSLIVPLYGHG